MMTVINVAMLRLAAHEAKHFTTPGVTVQCVLGTLGIDVTATSKGVTHVQTVGYSELDADKLAQAVRLAVKRLGLPVPSMAKG